MYHQRICNGSAVSAYLIGFSNHEKNDKKLKRDPKRGPKPRAYQLFCKMDVTTMPAGWLPTTDF